MLKCVKRTARPDLSALFIFLLDDSAVSADKVRIERLKGFECHCCERALNVVNVEQIIVDKFADVLPLGNVELHQKIEITAGRIELGVHLFQRDLIGNFVGCSGHTPDLNEYADHKSELLNRPPT